MTLPAAELDVRARRDGDLVLPVGADADQRDAGSHAGTHRHRRRDTLDPESIQRVVPEQVVADRADDHDPGPAAEGSCRGHGLVPALAAVVLREHPAGDRLAGRGKRCSRDHEVDVDRADHDDGAGHALDSTRERTRSTNLVMNDVLVDLEGDPGVRLGLPSHRPGAARGRRRGRRRSRPSSTDPRSRPRPVSSRVAPATDRSPRRVRAGRAGDTRPRRRPRRRSPCRSWSRPRCSCPSGESGAGAHTSSRSGRRMIARSVMSRPTQIGRRSSSTPEKAVKTSAAASRVHPDVRLRGGRHVAAAGERPAHQRESAQQLGKARLLAEGERDVREGAGRDEEHLTRPVARRADDHLDRGPRGGRSRGRWGAARPSPRSPWTTGNGTWSRTSGRAAPCATSTSPRPATSSTARVFSVACSTLMLPITQVAAIRSTSGDATA